MTPLATFGLLLLALTISCSQEQRESAVPVDHTADDVLAALETFSSAYAAADVETLSTLLTDQYVHSNSGGPVIRKENWLNWVGTRTTALADGTLVISTYENVDVVVEMYAGAAVVHGTNVSTGTENGEPFDKRIVFTHTWIYEDGAWKRASFHDSRL